MIEIKNVSNEAIEIIQTVDIGVKARRQKPQPPAPTVLEPGEVYTHEGYEPGVAFAFRPVRKSQMPRLPRGTR